MIPATPPAAGPLPASARLRSVPEDFEVIEELGFEPSGDGEHAMLFIEKRGRNTQDVVRALAELSGVPQRDIGFCGMKDRNAVTRQWFTVGLAGRGEPDWGQLDTAGSMKVLVQSRHQRKLRRGVHRHNRFRLRLRELEGDLDTLEQRLQGVAQEGFPNYFGPQRFGRDGATLARALQWQARGGKMSRHARSLSLSALRSAVFNAVLAQRVAAGTWNRVLDGDTCVLQGSRSRFACEAVDDELAARVTAGDVHPGLPLWGRGEGRPDHEIVPAEWRECCEFLETKGLELDWRAARARPDDFCREFCDDGSLHLEFALGAGCFATALLAECVRCEEQ